MIYAARFETMNALLAYLTENCCKGAPEILRSRSVQSRPRLKAQKDDGVKRKEFDS